MISWKCIFGELEGDQSGVGVSGPDWETIPDFWEEASGSESQQEEDRGRSSLSQGPAVEVTGQREMSGQPSDPTWALTRSEAVNRVKEDRRDTKRDAVSSSDESRPDLVDQ